MRRRFFLFAAPAIVAAPSLMKVSALVMPAEPVLSFSDIVNATLRNRPSQIAENIRLHNDILRRLIEIADAQDRALAQIRLTS